MKKAVILHGTDGSPSANWFPWAKSQLENAGYEAWVPELPNNHTPNRQTYNDFLFGAGWDFTDNVVIGHSSGAVSVLNMLMDARCPRIEAGIMVGAWAKMEGTDLEAEQFKHLFPADGFDFVSITEKADVLHFLHGSDDPHCPLEQARWLAVQTGSEITIVPNGHHLGSKFTELPELTSILRKYHLM